jgi:hypothetical protein
MYNIALFISGRLIGYKDCLLPFINNIKNKYNVFLFFSINSFSLDKNVEHVIDDLKNTFGETIGDIYFEEYKFPRIYVETHINNNIDVFSYNCLSQYYNDRKNMELIENFEKNNNIVFDILCKTRSDIVFSNNNVDFTIDNKNELIIRNKHIQDIRYWGHCYNDTPLMISDCFAYGNKMSMKYYCSTYDWILKNDLLLKGNYLHAGEIYLTDSILQHVFCNIPGGGNEPLLSREQIQNKYVNNPNKILIVYLNNIQYTLLPPYLRQQNNFIVDTNNVFNYTHIIN